MDDQLTVAFAYGASGVSTGEARRAFEANLSTPFRWAPIDWREHCLPGPDAAQLLALAARFDLPAPDGRDERPVRLSIDAHYLVALERAAGPRSAPLELTGGLGDIVRLVFDRRGLFRDVYRDGLAAVGTSVADILNYLDRRESVSACVAGQLSQAFDAAPGPVVVIGESVGGIMVVDALARMRQEGRDLERVRTVITFASQSAVLRHIRPAGDRIDPEPFTPWLNIWHRDDFLSYPIEDTYEELGGRVRDREARHRTTFPEVHTSYMTDPQSGLFEFIAEGLAR